jgi:hypothetical protein
MGLEQRRKQIMAHQPQWGDTTPSPPHLSSQIGIDQEARGECRVPPVATRENADLNALDALIMADPSTRSRPAMNKPQVTLSCKDWTLEWLVRKGKNFHLVPRVQWSPNTSISAEIEAHERANKGVPLVVEGLHNNPQWIKDGFTPSWLEQHGPQGVSEHFTLTAYQRLRLPVISARNVYDRTDKTVTLTDFIARARTMSPFATPGGKL